MSKLFTYIVCNDYGVAPNPFWDWCTLAICTPNHQGSTVQQGDWIAGFYEKKHGHKFLYAMEVCEKIHMDAYFRDRRFVRKKPKLSGTETQYCGDNMYYLDEENYWMQIPTDFHDSDEERRKDTKHPWVFVARSFWYLGRSACDIPGKFKALVGGRGVRVNHPPHLAEEFKEWVRLQHKKGVSALPRDMESPSFRNCGCLTPLLPLRKRCT